MPYSLYRHSLCVMSHPLLTNMICAKRQLETKTWKIVRREVLRRDLRQSVCLLVTVWLFSWDDDALELVLDFIFQEHKAFCWQIILEPPYNPLEKNVTQEQSWTVDLCSGILTSQSNNRRKLC